MASESEGQRALEYEQTLVSAAGPGHRGAPGDSGYRGCAAARREKIGALGLLPRSGWQCR